jgi:23S rRNA pseudouridine2605 synthase
VLRQGHNREIRRLLARAGHKVIFLQRVGFGPLRLGRLAVGKSRPLLPAEIKQLREYRQGGGESGG